MKKILIAAFLLIGATTAQAQSSEFKSLTEKLDGYLAKNRWDDVLLTAPDLLLEDPARGDGYYYLAYAFYKLEQPARAQDYLTKASAQADAALQVRIAQLKSTMQAQQALSQAAANAQKLENDGKPSTAVVEWEKAWKADKTNLSYALNAVGLYIGLRRYPEALDILRDPLVVSDAEAVRLIDRLNQTGQMKAVNGYNAALQRGKDQLKSGQYAIAAQSFKEALGFKASDAEASRQYDTAVDEVAWQRATSAATIEAFEAYLAGSSRRDHAAEATRQIQRQLLDAGEKYATANDIPNAELYLRKYLSQYPRGPEADKVKELLCSAYRRQADRNAATKSLYAQQQAVDFYERANGVCASTADLAAKLQKARHLAVRYGRPSRSFYTYAYDKQCQYGLALGTLNNRKVGVYFAARCNDEIFTSGGANGTVDNQGKVSGGQFVNWGNDWRFKNAVRTGSVEGLLGITKKVAYPFWVYAGAGVAYNQVYWSMDLYDNNGKFYTNDWVANSEASNIKPVLESGLIVDLSGFNLRGGVKTQDFKTLTLTLGVGLSFKMN